MNTPDRDDEHLKLLSILYYVWGGLTACGACFGSIYAIAGGVFMAAAAQGPGQNTPPPPWLGALLIVLGGVIAFIAIVFSVLNILTGRFLAQRQRHTFCFVMGALSCLSFPLGTALGIFTIIVLQRPSVKARFGPTPAPA